MFLGLPRQVEKDLGIGFTVGGCALIAVAGLAWFSLKLLMQRDEESAKHVYKAFGQVYIPSTRDYVDAISQGRSYKHSGGFLPNRSMQNNTKDSNTSSYSNNNRGQNNSKNNDYNNENRTTWLEVPLLKLSEERDVTTNQAVDHATTGERAVFVKTRIQEEEEIIERMLRDFSSAPSRMIQRNSKKM